MSRILVASAGSGLSSSYRSPEAIGLTFILGVSFSLLAGIDVADRYAFVRVVAKSGNIAYQFVSKAQQTNGQNVVYTFTDVTEYSKIAEGFAQVPMPAAALLGGDRIDFGAVNMQASDLISDAMLTLGL